MINAESQEHNLAPIADHAGLVPEAVPSAALAERLDRLELLIEEAGQENKFRTELYEYVKDLRAEARFVKGARLAFGILAFVACVFCLVAPIAICIQNYPWFSELPEYPRAALLIGQLASGVLILQNLVKSVYRSAAERQADEFIPPQVKLIHELTNGGKVN